MKHLNFLRMWVICGMLTAPQAALPQAPSVEETKAIAEEGFIYGLPIVMNYAVMHEYAVDKKSSAVQSAVQRDQERAPRRHLQGHGGHYAEQRHALFIALAGSARRADGGLGAGGAEEALLLRAVDRRQHLQLRLHRQPRHGHDAGDYLVVGPDWKGEKPAGIKQVFSSTTPFSLAVFRTQLFNADDMPNVEKVQAGYKVQPLSAFLKQPAPPAAPKIDFLPATTAGIKANFFEYLDAALQFVPPRRTTRKSAPNWRRIGIGPGKTFDFKDLSPEHKAAVLLGMKEGDDKVDKFLSSGMKNINGWNVGAFFGDAISTRAIGSCGPPRAKGGLYGNDAVEAMYPFTRVDADGRNARRQQAQLHDHVPRRAVPAGERLLVGDDVRRQEPAPDQEPDQPLSHQLADAARHEEERRRLAHALHPEGFARQGKESNWLPAPNDTIYLVMRLYWPRTESPSVLPAGEGTWKPPGIQQVS